MHQSLLMFFVSVAVMLLLYCLRSNQDNNNTLPRLSTCLPEDDLLMRSFVDALGPHCRHATWDPMADVCRWIGVVCDIQSNYIVEFSHSANLLPGCSGSLRLSALPRHLRKLEISNTRLSGSLNFLELPQTLEDLKIFRNEFTGTVDLTRLPPKLFRLWLHMNRFDGTVSLTSLPLGLRTIVLSHNNFHGSLDLTHLPQESLWGFSADHNQFSGSIDLTNLPQEFADLDLNNNNLSGSVELCRLPPNTRMVDLSHNHFSSNLRPFFRCAHPPTLHRFIGSFNHFHNDGSSSLSFKHMKMDVLDLRSNSLSGRVDLTEIPQSLTALFLGNNSLVEVQFGDSLPPCMDQLDLSNNVLVSYSTNASRENRMAPSPATKYFQCSILPIPARLDLTGNPGLCGVVRLLPFTYQDFLIATRGSTTNNCQGYVHVPLHCVPSPNDVCVFDCGECQ